jgi:hypothetical protein
MLSEIQRIIRLYGINEFVAFSTLVSNYPGGAIIKLISEPAYDCPD